MYALTNVMDYMDEKVYTLLSANIFKKITSKIQAANYDLSQEPSDEENSISAKVSDYINKFISWLPLTKRHIWYLATILPLLGEYGVGFGMYCLDVYSGKIPCEV